MGAAVLLLTTLVAAHGCGGEAPQPLSTTARPATLAELTGPWRAEPLLLEPALRARVEATCRRDIELGPDAVAVVVDARGASVVTVRMTGAESGNCDALEIAPGGDVAGAGGGWRGSRPGDREAVGEAELAEIEVGGIGGGSLEAKGWSVYGRAGSAIRVVVVEPLGQHPILATLDDGWFAAWWPSPVAPQAGQTNVHFRVVGYDASQVPLDEHVQ